MLKFSFPASLFILLSLGLLHNTHSQGLNSIIENVQGILGSLNTGGGSADSTGRANSGQNYDGSRVGPLLLFRSSADNANIVNDGFRGLPLLKMLGLAFGDELPKLRDNLIESSKSKQTPSQIILSSLTNLENWSFDRENNKKENETPFLRPSRLLLNSVRGSVRSLTGNLGGGSGLSGVLAGLGGNSLSSSGSSSSSDSSSTTSTTTSSPKFKISVAE